MGVRPEMRGDTADPSATLEELEGIRQRVRRDQRPGSIPLTVLTATMLIFTSMQWWAWATNLMAWTDGGPFWFWMIAAPLGFAIIGRWYQKIEREVGVSTQRIFGTLAIAAVVSLLVFPILSFPLGIPYAVLGTVFLVIGLSQRSGYLIAGAIIFGLGGALQSLHVISNRVYDLAGGFVSWAPPAAWTLLTALLAGVTAAAWRKEVGR